MFQSGTRTFAAFESVDGAIQGTQFTVYGVTFVCTTFYVAAGAVDIRFTTSDQAGELQIPPAAKPALQFFAPVGAYGPAGYSITQISFTLMWGDVATAGSLMDEAGIDVFFTKLGDCYGVARQALEAVATSNNLAALAGTPALPALSQWQGVPNDEFPVSSIAPNSLNSAEAAKYAAMPQVFSVLAVKAPDEHHFLVAKMATHQGTLTLGVELCFASAVKPQLKQLKTWDMTHLLPDGLPYFYVDQWDNYFSYGDAPLNHILASPPDDAHSIMIPGVTRQLTVNFNMGFAQTYNGGTSTPICSYFGMLPAAAVPVQPTDAT